MLLHIQRYNNTKDWFTYCNKAWEIDYIGLMLDYTMKDKRVREVKIREDMCEDCQDCYVIVFMV